MRGLLIGAIMIGAMANPLAAQAVVTLEPAGGAYSYSLGGVVALPVGDAVPALVMASPHQWGLPYGSAAPTNSGVPDWVYRSPCEVTPELCSHGASGFPDWGYASDPAFYPDTPRGLLSADAERHRRDSGELSRLTHLRRRRRRWHDRRYASTSGRSPAAIPARLRSLSSLRMARSNQPLRCGSKAKRSIIPRPAAAQAGCQSILSTVRQHASSMPRNTLTSGWPEIRQA